MDGADFFIVLFLCRWYVFSLLYRNLIVSYLCWVKDVLKCFQDNNIDIGRSVPEGRNVKR